MKIISLSSENVLRLNAVEITPGGNIVIVGGKNGEGKSSVLNSIELAMAGVDSKRYPEPLHRGAKKGKIVCDLDDIVVERSFTESGSYLKVMTKEGAAYPSPQKMLSKLVGEISFDPLSWAQMDQRKQLDTLKRLVGMDFTDEDAKRKEIYEQRAAVNSEVRRLTAVLASSQKHPDAPDSEVSVQALMGELKRREAHNRRIDEQKSLIGRLSHKVLQQTQKMEAIDTGIEDLKAEFERSLSALKVRLKGAEDEHKTAVYERDVAVTTFDAMKSIGTEAVTEEINTADSVNRMVRENKERAKTELELADESEVAESLTAQINDIDTAKIKKLSSAKFPVEGLSFDENGVLFNSIPFQQASSAEKLRVSVAMGIAINPKLRVLLVRDGSLLDEENLKLLAEMAEEADAQVWVERVGKGKECQVIIEDGTVEQ